MLNNILRVLQITRLFIKYDVDKMLVNCGSGKCKFYFYMLPWNWFRKRHVENIHGANTNSEKRKRNESTEERYLKRQKTINKVPVSYQNYF